MSVNNLVYLVGNAAKYSLFLWLIYFLVGGIIVVILNKTKPKNKYIKNYFMGVALLGSGFLFLVIILAVLVAVGIGINEYGSR